MRAQSVIFQSKAISSITIGDCGKHYSAFNCKKYKDKAAKYYIAFYVDTVIHKF